MKKIFFSVLVLFTIFSAGCNRKVNKSTEKAIYSTEEKTEEKRNKDFPTKKNGIENEADMASLFYENGWVITEEKNEHLSYDKILKGEHNYMYTDKFGINHFLYGESPEEASKDPRTRGLNGRFTFFDKNKVIINGNVYFVRINDDKSVSLIGLRFYAADGLQAAIPSNIVYYPFRIDNKLYAMVLDGDSQKKIVYNDEQAMKLLEGALKVTYSDVERISIPDKPSEDEILNVLADEFEVDRGLLSAKDKKNDATFNISIDTFDGEFKVSYFDELALLDLVNFRDEFVLRIVYNYATKKAVTRAY